MPYFHAVALFEGRGSSFDETDQAVVSLLASISHRRLRYYEHETTEGPHSGRAAASFVIFADFDVEAYTEEKASDLVDEVLDAVSTDDIQYFSHGLLSGEQRVPSARQAPAKDEQNERDDQNEQNEQNERDDQDEGRDRRSSRGGRRRGTRGRGRGQADEAAIAPTAIQETLPETPEAEPVPVVDSPHIDPLIDEAAPAGAPILTQHSDESAEQIQPAQSAQPDELNELDEPDELDELDKPDELDAYDSQNEQIEHVEHVEQFEPNDQTGQDEPIGLVEIPLELDLDLPAVPPVRSSSAMQTKTSVTLRASELGLSKDTLPAEEELIALAATEARRRHPALPADSAPEAELETLPWGDVVLTLSWSDDVPVPSAGDDA